MENQQDSNITIKEKEQLIKAHQGELDAVLLYKKLAGIVKEKKYKELFLKIAADEGKHAGILRNYTGANLKPKNFKALLVSSIYRILGLKFTLKMLSNGEYKAVGDYAPLVVKFPNINEIMKDEEKHSNLMKDMKN